MSEPASRLYLITPLVEDAAAFAPRLREACAAGDVAAVLLRLAEGDERTLVNRVKALAPAAQDQGAAVLAAASGAADLITVMARGGADGVHVQGEAAVRAVRERARDRIVGAGGLRSKHDAMMVAEREADYLLFGEPRDDGTLPPYEAVVERVAWWTPIFETPCVAYAPTLEAVAGLVAAGAEFVALGETVWSHPAGPGTAVEHALAALSSKGAAR